MLEVWWQEHNENELLHNKYHVEELDKIISARPPILNKKINPMVQYKDDF